MRKFHLSGTSSRTSLLLAGFCFALAGCSVTGFEPDVDRTATSSIAPIEQDFPLQETVDPSDWDKVREVMGLVLASQPAGSTVEWENDVTGTIGTIVPMALVPHDDGKLCRKFSTTMNGIGGVSQYRGDACKTPKGGVELVDVAPLNSVVDALSDKSKQVQ